MRALRFLDENFEKILLAILLISMSLIIGMQVFMRYVMKSSLSWSEEVARYVFIWMIYIGISYGVKQNRHIRIAAALDLFPKASQKYFKLISDLIFLGFSLVVILKSSEVSSLIFRLVQTSPATGISMGYVYLAVPFGFSLVAIRLLQRIVKRFKYLKTDEEI